MKTLLELLAQHGGEIVCTASLDTNDINQARESGRMYVDENGIGFVWMPKLDRLPETDEEVEFFEKWFPLEVPLPEELKNPDFLFAENRNPMSTTAEEFLNTECREFGGHDFLYIEKVREYARLYHQEKLREAGGMDISAIRKRINELANSRTDGSTYKASGMSDMLNELLPKIAAMKQQLGNLQKSLRDVSDMCEVKDMKIAGLHGRISCMDADIAQLQAENEVLKEELSGGVHSCHSNCQNPTCIIRRERDQFQAEKDLMWEYFREMAKLAGDRAKFELRLNALKLKLGLASLPEEKPYHKYTDGCGCDECCATRDING